MSMIGLGLVLDGVAKLLGLGSWYSRNLNKRVMVYYQPENKKSFVDKYIRKQGRKPACRMDKVKLKAADALVKLIRKLVDYEAFRLLVRALALSDSPLRRMLSRGGKASVQ